MVVLAGATVAGCYRPPDATEWGPEAKAHFVASCTHEVRAGNGTTTTIAIADQATCECIYDEMVNTFNLKWDDMKDYERELSRMSDGDDPPKAPAALTKALDACEDAGKAGPRVTTTTAADEEAEAK